MAAALVATGENRQASAPRKRRASAPKGGSLTEHAYQLIKERIISAKYVPGQFLQEARICADLKLGRTPVHQALHRLHQEGLLDIIPRKGILIRTESLAEIFMALEARMLIEPYFAEQCAERASTAEMAEIESLMAQYRKLQKDGDKAPMMEVDRRFHAAIAQVGGNSLLVEFLRPIQERMSRMWFLPHWQARDYSVTEAEHDKLMQALKSRDGKAAADAMREHIESLRRRIMSAKI
ncbi:GntR family transcriptional regulator [Ancylobacter sp. WKF20]|uniref:GntR family transcriptional regulator n=1 Tax=Ancylobacter sp. WKF20 TaxID=3039801 RepID=UPI00243411AB|nr:GntR family transcriptional regulator [Ancylobacter sp. WKF20]WGD29735.1 GntR family transcriptional regulator [Ancylobacter sp. WKF20]